MEPASSLHSRSAQREHTVAHRHGLGIGKYGGVQTEASIFKTARSVLLSYPQQNDRFILCLIRKRHRYGRSPGIANRRRTGDNIAIRGEDHTGRKQFFLLALGILDRGPHRNQRRGHSAVNLTGLQERIARLNQRQPGKTRSRGRPPRDFRTAYRFALPPWPGSSWEPFSTDSAKVRYPCGRKCRKDNPPDKKTQGQTRKQGRSTPYQHPRTGIRRTGSRAMIRDIREYSGGTLAHGGGLGGEAGGGAWLYGAAGHKEDRLHRADNPNTAAGPYVPFEKAENRVRRRPSVFGSADSSAGSAGVSPPSALAAGSQASDAQDEPGVLSAGGISSGLEDASADPAVSVCGASSLGGAAAARIRGSRALRRIGRVFFLAVFLPRELAHSTILSMDIKTAFAGNRPARR